MTKKELIRKINTLEEYLGIGFVKGEKPNFFDEYISRNEWSLEKRIQKLENNNKKDK